jgi:hypothetical protein
MESVIMDMPITKPSMVAYADQLEFSQLLEELSQTKKNGFIRVTSGSEDGYLLFKDGKQVAASYDNLSKVEALDKIRLAMEDYKTLVEVFDIRPSQVSYLMGLNKPYLLEKVPDIEEVLGELKKDKNETAEGVISKESEDISIKTGSEEEVQIAPETEKPPENTETSKEPSVSTELSADEDETATTAENTLTAESSAEVPSEEVNVEEKAGNSENEIGDEPPVAPESSVTTPDVENTPSTMETSTETLEASSDVLTPSTTPDSEVSEPETRDDKTDPEDAHVTETKDKAAGSGTDSIDGVDSTLTEGEGSSEAKNAEPMDRTELLKKYGIKDIDEEDVEKVLESYTGGYLSDNDVEKVELTLMNRIKKSIMGLPKVKGTEVMIFLDNAGNDLRGNINVIMEYQSQGFLSRIVGGSKEVNNLKRQVIGICNMEIRKIFREYPEVVDKFEINVEIS